MKRTKLFPVILRCGHEILCPDAPNVGDIAPCFRCHRGQVVTFVRRYTARCVDCSYRNHEGDLTRVSELARAHANRCQHEVTIWYPTIEAPIVLVPNLSDVVSSLRQIA